jgi:nicotinamidase-related amidase
VVFKRKHSAFFETVLDERLRAAGVSSIYLTGMQTQICIMTTAVDASFRRYHTVAISDCVVSTLDQAKQEAFVWIRKYVGGVQSLEDVRKEFAHV